MRRQFSLLGTLAAACLFTFSAFSQSYDFAAAGRSIACGIGTPTVTPVLEFVPGLDESPTDVLTIAALGDGRILAALEATGAELVELRPDRTRTPFFSGAPGQIPREIVADGAGNVYVLTGQPAMTIVAVNADGTLRDTMTLPAAAAGIDLAADQCTLFYTRNGAIARYNVCTGTPLPDFASIAPGNGGFPRILPDDHILFVEQQAGTDLLRMYAPDGTLLSTRGLPADVEPQAVALARNGRSLLVADGCEGRVFEIDLVNGGVLRVVELEEITLVESLVSATGFSAAIGALAATEIPTASMAGLISLAALALLIALWKLNA
ncbi:MAG TPA: hypothetical protein VEK11_01110 [Thermoanaerobaculia bacterium]|nr:hypothetical protein [Thermoanaerobaculia bacterium]